MSETIYNSDAEKINALFVGRKVVKVAESSAQDYDWSDAQKAGTLILDNGTELQIIPNEGCGGCSAGWYELKALNTCDNVITRAEVEVDGEESYGDFAGTYTLFVYADNEKINLATVEGDDGNGYYGTGFRIVVKA